MYATKVRVGFQYLKTGASGPCPAREIRSEKAGRAMSGFKNVNQTPGPVFALQTVPGKQDGRVVHAGGSGTAQARRG